MSKRKARTILDVCDATSSLCDPQIPCLRINCMMQVPVNKAGHINTVIPQIKKEFGCCSDRSQEVDCRIKSGTCNVCSAPCSSCYHDNQILMKSAVESAGETCAEHTVVDWGKQSEIEQLSGMSIIETMNSSADSSEIAVCKALSRTSDAPSLDDAVALSKFAAQKVPEGDDNCLSHDTKICDTTKMLNFTSENGHRMDPPSSSLSICYPVVQRDELTTNSLLCSSNSRGIDVDKSSNPKVESLESSKEHLNPSLVGTVLTDVSHDLPATAPMSSENIDDMKAEIHPMDGAEDSDMVEQDVKVCDICGDAGREDLLAICCRCSDGAEHTYCMREMLAKVPEIDWMCEECKSSEKVRYQRQEKLGKMDEIEKNNSGQASSERMNSYDVEGNKTTGCQNIPTKRPRDDADTEVSSVVKKPAVDSTFGTLKLSRSDKAPALSRENSLKNLDKGKVQPSHGSPTSDAVTVNNTPEFAGPDSDQRSPNFRGTFSKPNSFAFLNSKPKVKLVDQVLQRKIRLKNGTIRSIGRSVSFKSTNSIFSESKTKMLSPRLSNIQDIKNTKRRSLFERQGSLRSEDRPINSMMATSMSSASRKDKRLVSRAESCSLSVSTNQHETKPIQLGKAVALSRSSSIASRQSADLAGSVGDFKKPSTYGLNTPRVSSANDINNFDEKSNHTSPNEDSSSCSGDFETPHFSAIECRPDGFAQPGMRNGSSFVVDDFCFSNSMQPEELESKASISSPIKSQDADFFKYNLFEQKDTDVHDDIQVSLLQEQARGSSSSLAWDDKTEIREPVAEDYVKSGITQEDDRNRNTESFSQILGIETIGGKEVNLETVYTVDVKPTNEAMRNLETCDVNLDHIESETDQFVDALNTIGLEPDDGQSEVKRHRSECETSRAESNVLAYNDMVNDSIVHDPILFSQKSHTAAYCSINGVAANSELQSVVAVDKDVHSALRTGEPVNSTSPLKVDYIENADIDEGINVESVSSSMSSNYKGDNIDVGTSREAVPYTVSSNFFANKSGVPSVDRPRSSPESHKPAPETSNVSPVMFWTNGVLLGLQPSKPPDCGLANVLPQYPLSSTGNSEDRLDRGSSMCQENQECGSSIRKISLKIPPVALEIKNDYVYPNNNSGLPSSLATRSDMLVNSEFQADRQQENIRDSSHKSEFRNTGVYYRKPSRGGNEIDIPASYQNAGDFEQKNGENIACRIFSGRNKDLVGFGSSTLSPSASPPLEHMKMPFQPIDGFQAPRLKLKFPDGNYNSESRRIVFPSFQLVPEVSSMTHNDGSDSDDDTFYRSSPSLMDEFPCHQSESNSEKWESGESPCSKDPDLYDTFHRISLTDSIVTVPGNGRISKGDICGVLCPIENGVQNSKSCHSSDLRSLDTENPSLKEYLGKNASSHDLLGPECTLAPTTQSLPPVQWCSLNSHQNDMEDESQSMPEASKYVFKLKLSASTVSQPKPAPSNQDPIMETQYIQNSQSSGLCDSNGQRDANQSNGKDEMGDFLHQLRTRSFNLRSTVTSKPAAPTGTQANVQVTAILEKASAVRQAVDSDDEEDNGTWSDP